MFYLLFFFVFSRCSDTTLRLKILNSSSNGNVHHRPLQTFNVYPNFIKYTVVEFFFLDTLNIIAIKYLPEIVFIAFQKVWPHQKHSNKWKPYCCLLLIWQNKILQILVVLVLAHSGCAAETSTRTEQCTYGIWLHVGDCTNIHCTWRLQTDSSLRYSTSQMHEVCKKRFPPLYNFF